MSSRKLPPPPTTLEQYKKWLKIAINFDEGEQQQDYETLSHKLLRTFADGKLFPLWSEIFQNLPPLQEEYYIRTDYELFSGHQELKLVEKPFESYLSKAFRMSFVWSPHNVPVGNYPSLSEKQLERFRPDNLYEKAGDIVRTVLTVKYLDGVDICIKRFANICTRHNVPYRHEYKSGDDGYYAAHFYIYSPVEIRSLVKGRTVRLQLSIEIQITTQLQEVLRKFMHKLYERKRLSPSFSDIPWQWRYHEDEFFTNYLGHILHNMEGLIMDVRKRQAKAPPGAVRPIL